MTICFHNSIKYRPHVSSLLGRLRVNFALLPRQLWLQGLSKNATYHVKLLDSGLMLSCCFRRWTPSPSLQMPSTDCGGRWQSWFSSCWTSRKRQPPQARSRPPKLLLMLYKRCCAFLLLTHSCMCHRRIGASTEGPTRHEDIARHPS